MDTRGRASFIVRLISPQYRIDYLYAFVIGACPIMVAFVLGAAKDSVLTCSGETLIVKGYLSFPNWWSLAILFPLLLYVFRWLFQKIAPVQDKNLGDPTDTPPIIRLIKDDASKGVVYSSLRLAISDKRNWIAALAIALLVNILDVWPKLVPYFSEGSADNLNWMVLFTAVQHELCSIEIAVSKFGNLGLLASAYLAQLAISSLGILTIILVFRHNLFFVNNVYQRRRERLKPAEQMFMINVEDVNRCFGFRAATGAFNTQVIGLTVAGAAMLMSRYAHTSDRLGQNGLLRWPPVLPELSLSVAGQWAMAIAWLVALAIVAIPSVVKLLPRFPSQGAKKTQHSIKYYLQEFFSEASWPKDVNGEKQSIEWVSGQFARNSFWPTGDNRARILFFFSYWIFLVILLPPALDVYSTLALALFVYAVIAYILTYATFALLKLSVAFVDNMLVTIPSYSVMTNPSGTTNSHLAKTTAKHDIGIFISYRRADTIEYARSIHKELSVHFNEDRLFRDLSAIEPGENFVHAIQNSLADVDVIIVLIGADWVTLEDDQGRVRLHQPNDMVFAEVSAALSSGKRVIPLLLERATMPSSDDLPNALKPLSQLNALEISDTRWDYDLGLLVDAIKKIIDDEP